MDAKEIYKIYRRKVQGIIIQYQKDITALNKQIASLFSLLGLYQDTINDTKMSFAMIKHIANREEGYKDDLEYIKKYGVATSLGNKMLFEDKNKLTIAITTLLDIVDQLNHKEFELAIFKKFAVSYQLFSYIRREFNFKISNALLKGYKYYLGGHMGSIYIYEAKRSFEYKGKSIKTVDRGQSWKNLIYIAETYSPKSKQLLKDYRDNKIKQLDFIARMKEFTYPKTDRKWISYYHSDTAVWVRWTKATCACKNKSIFKFEPTNYINTASRLVDDEIKNDKGIQNVIESKDLGIIQKINIIKKMKDSYFNNFNKDIYDLQTS